MFRGCSCRRFEDALHPGWGFAGLRNRGFRFEALCAGACSTSWKLLRSGDFEKFAKKL
jgi:hypothetical protein